MFKIIIAKVWNVAVEEEMLGLIMMVWISLTIAKAI
jgi:hypothetical protein